MRDAEAKCVFVFLQHFGEEGGLARPAGPHDGEELSRSDHSAYCNTKL